MSHALAVTLAEFRQAFNACLPPTGWGKRIAVAVSGGPDSMALLGLLRDIQKQDGVKEPEVVAFTVDHGLRPESSQEAATVSSFCKSINVRHSTLTIPWSMYPYPERPMGKEYELVARWARYYALFRAMRHIEADALFTGHQANDQLETAILRGQKHSGLVGMLGMRRVRRFGIGPADPLQYFGLNGLRMWMCRPLLTFSKGRLEATCESLGIPYVHEPSNFDPTVSARNAIRATLAASQRDEPLPWSDRLRAFNLDENASRELASVLDGVSPTASVDEIALHMSNTLDSLTAQVDDFLGSALSPDAAIGTASLDCTVEPPSEQVENAAVARILRYLSPKSWGHPAAEAGRRTDSFRRIANNLWHPQPWTSETGGPMFQFVPFSAGSGVLWTPSKRSSPVKGITWLVTREPPRASYAAAMRIDLTEAVLEAARTRTSPPPIVWDNRFSVHIPHHFPDELVRSLEAGHGRVKLQPHTKFVLPMVKFDGDGEVLGALFPDGRVTSGDLFPHGRVTPWGWRFEWIRPFTDVGS